MTHKESVKYENSILSNMKVNSDGSIENDNYNRFSLVKEGETSGKPIIAKTVAEAIHKSINTISLDNFPSEDDIKNDIDGKYNELYSKLINLSSFSAWHEHGKDMIVISNDNFGTYNLTYDKGNDDNIILNILSIEIDDNIVKTYSCIDDDTIICTIASSSFSIIGYKINNDISSTENANRCKEYIQIAMASLVNYMGIASYNSDDPGEAIDWSSARRMDFGKRLAYKRAISKKIRMDRFNSMYFIECTNKTLKATTDVLARLNRMKRKFSRREKQINYSIKSMTKKLQ